MSQALVGPANCHSPCEDQVVVQVAGPPGPSAYQVAVTNGFVGSEAAWLVSLLGTPGQPNYTFTTASFVMPASGADIIISVLNTDWTIPEATVYVPVAGWMNVISITDSTHLRLGNPGYPENAAAATVIASGTKIVPSGLRGNDGDPTTTTLNELSPTTTKGDLIVDNGANAPDASEVRFAAGTNGKFLKADSAQAAGLLWDKVSVGDATEIDGTLALGNGGTGQTTAQLAINALANAAGSATGDILYFNGTNWIRLPRGTALQLLRTNGAGTNIEWAAPPASSLVQFVSASSAAYSTLSTAIPGDDTIPQNTEGDQFLSLAITPANAANTLIIEVSAVFGIALGSEIHINLALFEDTTVNAIAASENGVNATDQAYCKLRHILTAGSTTARTYKVRAGTNGGDNIYLNGSSANRIFGGVQKAWLTITEVAP